MQNLAETVTATIFTKMFEEYGTIKSTRRIFDPETDLPTGTAFVEYLDSSSAHKAIEQLDDFVIHGESIKVSYPNARPSGPEKPDIYITGLCHTIDKAKLISLFSRFGTVEYCNILLDENKKSKGVGFIRFEDPSVGDLAIQSMHNTVLPGSSTRILVKYAKSKKRKLEQESHTGTKKRPCLPPFYPPITASSLPLPPIPFPPQHQSMDEKLDESLCLFVYHVDPSCTETDLRTLFQRHATVTNISIPIDKSTGIGKGFAFVNVAEKSEGEKCISQLHGFEFIGKRLRVDWKQPKSSSSISPPQPPTFDDADLFSWS